MTRGEVYDARLDPTVGSEQAGTRPVVIVSRDAIDAVSPVILLHGARQDQALHGDLCHRGYAPLHREVGCRHAVIDRLPQAEHNAKEWQTAMATLLLVAERDGPEMMARIGMMQALNRHGAKADPRRNAPGLIGSFGDQGSPQI